MTALKYAACFPLAFALSACDNQPSKIVPVGDEPVIEELQTDTTQSVEEDDRGEVALPPENSAPDADGFESAYSNFKLDNCDLVQNAPEKTYECAGYQDINIFARDADGRFTLAAGKAPDFLVQRQPLNQPGEKIEWRLKDGNPHAIIYRLNPDESEAANSVDGILVVASLPANGQSGCAQALVKQGSDQIKAARRYANMINGESDCPNEPAILGGER